jgi:ribosomal protein S16
LVHVSNFGGAFVTSMPHDSQKESATVSPEAVTHSCSVGAVPTPQVTEQGPGTFRQKNKAGAGHAGLVHVSVRGGACVSFMPHDSQKESATVSPEAVTHSCSVGAVPTPQVTEQAPGTFRQKYMAGVGGGVGNGASVMTGPGPASHLPQYDSATRCPCALIQIPAREHRATASVGLGIDGGLPEGAHRCTS